MLFTGTPHCEQTALTTPHQRLFQQHVPHRILAIGDLAHVQLEVGNDLLECILQLRFQLSTLSVPLLLHSGCLLHCGVGSTRAILLSFKRPSQRIHALLAQLLMCSHAQIVSALIAVQLANFRRIRSRAWICWRGWLWRLLAGGWMQMHHRILLADHNAHSRSDPSVRSQRSHADEESSPTLYAQLAVPTGAACAVNDAEQQHRYTRW
jgi:hypothetical protein